jgi:hypothetical protein
MDLKTLVVAGVALFSAVALNGQTAVTHSAPACIPTSGMAKLLARADGAETIRVYFAAHPTSCAEHYIEMTRSDAAQFWAALPIPADATTSVTYRFEARDASGSVIATSAAVTVPVQGGCGASTFSPQEQQIANNNIVGMTDEQQDNKLCGFKCQTVAHIIAVDGQMSPYDCDVWSPAKKLGYGAGFLGTGAIIGILLSDDDDPEQVSPVRP